MQIVDLKKTPRALVISSIQKAIDSGTLREGDALPSEQMLREKFKVARTTVRAALSELEARNLICFKGRRRIVCKTASRSRSLLSESIVILDDNRIDLDDLPENHVISKGHSVKILQGIKDTAQKKGLHIFVFNPASTDTNEIDQLIKERPTGIVLLHYNQESYKLTKKLLKLIKHSKIPLSCYIVGDSNIYEDVPTVASDHRKGCYLATKWLIKKGCKNILRYWRLPTQISSHPDWLAERNKGYQQAIEEAGLQIYPPIQYQEDVRHIQGNKKEFDKKVYQCVGRLYELEEKGTKVDGILCSSDGVTFSLAKALKMLGKKPNEDVLIAGYDNYAVECDDSQWESGSPIITVDKNNSEIGRTLVEQVIRQSKNESPEGLEHLLLPPELVVLNR